MMNFHASSLRLQSVLWHKNGNCNQNDENGKFCDK